VTGITPIRRISVYWLTTKSLKNCRFRSKSTLASCTSDSRIPS